MITDRKDLLELVAGLIASEDKPQGILPIDVLLTVRLLLQGGHEQPTSVSRETLAQQLACSDSTIYESQQRLKKLGWINFQSGQRRGVPNKLTVMIDELPIADEMKRTFISDAMKKLAFAYKTKLLKLKPRRKFHKNVIQTYAFRLQTLLDKKCNGDETLLLDVIRFAFDSAVYRKVAEKGPYLIRRHWKSLYQDFLKSKAREQSAAIAAQTDKKLEAAFAE